MDWKKIEEVKYKAGYRKLINKTFILPSGQKADYDVIDSGKIVCVVPVTNDGFVVLAKSYRPGPEKLMLEFPGGCMEENESPEQAARRELVEETGYDGKLELLASTYDDAYSTAYRYHFIAKNCKKVAKPEPEYDETGEVFLMPISELSEHIHKGELTDPETGLFALRKLEHRSQF